MDISEYIQSLKNKYQVDQTEVEQLIKDTTFVNRPKYLIGKNILFVDGLIKTHFQEYGVVLKFDNILTFRCCNRCTHHDLKYTNITLLQDNRIYSDNDSSMSINYVKKINFNRYKKQARSPDQPTALIYATRNCRYVSRDQLMDIIESYSYDRYIILSDHLYNFNMSGCSVISPPVNGLFDIFTDYIYTPLQKRFDCSPRLPAECVFYNKNVMYHDIDDDYLESDTGLKYRRQDIQNNFDNITLEFDDDIINILDDTI
jgi:hypothetical protein